MRAVVLATAAMLVMGLPARADGLRDATRGINAAAHNKYDDAVALYTEALKSGEFSARDQASLYDKRGVAYASLGQMDRAIADFDAVLRLKPNYVFAHFNRGVALDAAGRHAAAIADFDAAILYDPQSGAGYFYRGQANFHARRFAVAAGDFAQNARLAPADALGQVWLYLTRARAGIPAARELAQAAATLDPKRWPGPVMALFLGKLPPQQLMAATASGDPGVAADRRCQALFYIGEHALLQRRRGAARASFREAARQCPPTLIEATGARAELLHLDE